MNIKVWNNCFEYNKWKDNFDYIIYFFRTVPYPLLMLILVLALLVLSPHKGEQIQTIQMGLFLSNAISLEMVQLTWEDHGEVMLELFSIILKCPTLYNH